jgi:hypothetical protein
MVFRFLFFAFVPLLLMEQEISKFSKSKEKAGLFLA